MSKFLVSLVFCVSFSLTAIGDLSYRNQGHGGTVRPTKPRDRRADAIVELLNRLKLVDSNEKYEIGKRLQPLVKEMGEGAIPILLKELQTDSVDDVFHAEIVRKVIVQLGEKAVPDLIKALSNKNDVVRENAARVLKEIGKEAKAAIPALIKALEDNRDVAREAQKALIEMGKLSVPALEKVIWHRDASIRSIAVYTLGKIGEAAKSAIPELKKALTSKRWYPKGTFQKNRDDYYMGEVAREAIESIGTKEVVPVFLELLENEDNHLRDHGEKALRAIGAKAYSPHYQASKEEKEKMRVLAQRAIPGLVKLLKHKDRNVRRAAAYSLGEASRDESAKDAVSALIAMLKRGDERYSALVAMVNMGEKGHQALPELGKIVITDKENRLKAFSALAGMGEKAVPVIEKAFEQLESKNSFKKMGSKQQKDILKVLTKLGTKGIPVLEKVLVSRDARVRVEVVNVVKDLGGDAFPVIENALGDSDYRVRHAAMEAIADKGFMLGRNIVSTIPTLTMLLDSKGWYERARAADALAKMGNAAYTEALISKLTKMRDKDRAVRRAARQAIFQIGK